MEIKARNLVYTYMKGTPFEKEALTNINMFIPNNTFVAIVGHTGSGKSTLSQLLSGLIKPTEGTIHIGDWVIEKETKQKALYSLRKNVGTVFQFSEYQLFEETVLKDVMYGPINYGKSTNEAELVAKEMLTLVGITPNLFNKSPFELSGGQMRRVAVAGVLALEPKVLILDEPTAGLDPVGHDEIMEIFLDWYQGSKERSVFLITHHMEDVVKYGEHVIVLDQGQIILEGKPETVFGQTRRLNDAGLAVPESVSLLTKLNRKVGSNEICTIKFRVDDIVEEIVTYLGKGK